MARLEIWKPVIDLYISSLIITEMKWSFMLIIVCLQLIDILESYRLNVKSIKMNEKRVIHLKMSESSVTSIRKWSMPNLKLLSVLFIPLLQSNKAIASDLDSFIGSLAIMMEARTLISPTNQYVEIQAYDNVRNNCQYILNQLQFQKNVKNLIQQSIDFCDDMDAIEQAQEAGNRITNTVMQYDSSVYTCIFIPSDDGSVPPSAVKYRNEAQNYYKSFNSDISALLKLANESQLQAATKKAEAAINEMPKVLFKKAIPKTIGSING